MPTQAGVVSSCDGWYQAVAVSIDLDITYTVDCADLIDLTTERHLFRTYPSIRVYNDGSVPAVESSCELRLLWTLGELLLLHC